MELKFKLIIFFCILFFGKAFAQPPYCTDPPIMSACGSIEASGGVSPNRGCDSVVATFTNNSVGDIDSTYYCWGDGRTSAFRGIRSDTHTFYRGRLCDTTYRVRMTVVKNCPAGKSIHSMLTYVTVLRTPSVSYWTSSATFEAGVEILFTNESSVTRAASNGVPCQSATCRWEFGDSTISEGLCKPIERHTYTVAGDYNVRLTVLHTCANVGFSNPTPLSIFYKPVINIQMDSIACANTLVTLTNRSQYVKKHKWSVVSVPLGGNVSFSDPAGNNTQPDTLPAPQHNN